jgi:hypothetical protein
MQARAGTRSWVPPAGERESGGAIQCRRPEIELCTSAPHTECASIRRPVGRSAFPCRQQFSADLRLPRHAGRLRWLVSAHHRCAGSVGGGAGVAGERPRVHRNRPRPGVRRVRSSVMRRSRRVGDLDRPAPNQPLSPVRSALRRTSALSRRNALTRRPSEGPAVAGPSRHCGGDVAGYQVWSAEAICSRNSSGVTEASAISAEDWLMQPVHCRLRLST